MVRVYYAFVHYEWKGEKCFSRRLPAAKTAPMAKSACIAHKFKMSSHQIGAIKIGAIQILMAEDNALFDHKMALLPVETLSWCLHTFEASGLNGEAFWKRIPKDPSGNFVVALQEKHTQDGRAVVL
ncbi:hypothetical protein Tco_0556421 [Tanacetum coccineum]